MQEVDQSQPISLYLESNPNPNSLKFVSNQNLVADGATYDFASKEEAENSALASQLFLHDFVERVFIMSNFVTVTKSDAVDWMEIQTELKNEILAFLQTGEDLVSSGAKVGNSVSDSDTDDIKKIKTILDEYVRPAVEQDGGAIIFDSYVEGIVKVQLQGSCSGCPSSTITLKAGIENLLKSMMPEVQAVEAESI